MKNFHSLILFCTCLSLFTLTSCEEDGLNELELDIVGEWVVDDYLLSGDDLVGDGVIQDMHMIFSSNLDVEISWFEGGNFFVVNGDWRGEPADPSLRIDLDERVFFFCDDNDVDLNIFFFAGDMQLDTDCGGSGWMEIQLERF